MDSRHRAVALFVLASFTSSPLFNAVCTAFCEPPAASEPSCGESSSAHQGRTPGPRIESNSPDCCDHVASAAGASAASLTIRRSEASGIKDGHASMPTLEAHVFRYLCFRATASAGRLDPPPAPAPSSLVLRI